MARLKAGFVAIALAWGAPAAAGPTDRWAVHIREASERFGIAEAWIKRVMQAESGGRTMLAGQPIRSHAGAIGLMQVMPGTWREMRAAHRLGRDPDDPRDNILAGTAYLRAMYDRFGYPGLFAAYNAGPARYAQHLSAGRALPAETVAYVKLVAADRDTGATPVRTRRVAPIFVSLTIARPEAPAPPQPRSPQSTLFVRLGAAAE